MKRNRSILLYLSLFIVISILFSTNSIAEVSLFGVTLGKTLDIKKCRKQSEYDCYTTNDLGIADICITELRKNLSFYAKIKINFEKDCDRKSKVSYLYAEINPDDYEKIFTLMVQKFGDPESIDDSIVSNRFGAQFQQKEAFWTIEDCELYLSRYSDTVSKGTLSAIHKIGIDKLKAKKEKDANKDASNF